jgi:hypothetical protein
VGKGFFREFWENVVVCRMSVCDEPASFEFSDTAGHGQTEPEERGEKTSKIFDVVVR